LDRPHHHEHFAAGKMLGMRKNDMVLVGLASLTNYLPNEFGINAWSGPTFQPRLARRSAIARSCSQART
jgi:hypothetical protein